MLPLIRSKVKVELDLKTKDDKVDGCTYYELIDNLVNYGLKFN